MNCRWAITKTISTGIAVIEAADNCTFHNGPWYASVNCVRACGSV